MRDPPRARVPPARAGDLADLPAVRGGFTGAEARAPDAYQVRTSDYDILFRAASETLRTIAADPKHLGAESGVVAGLHSWGQNLSHHPHLHCLVPGGGIAQPAARALADPPLDDPANIAGS